MILITPFGIKGEMLSASALRAECLMGGVWGRKLEAWGLKQKTLAALDGRRETPKIVQRPASSVQRPASSVQRPASSVPTDSPANRWRRSPLPDRRRQFPAQ